MTEEVLERPSLPRISTGRILLPTEHGSWSFLVEPLLAGSIIAWSGAAPWIAVMVVAAFFARQPIKVYWLSRRTNPRASALAFRWAILFLSAAALGFLATAWISRVALYPLVVAIPIALQQISADLSRQSRSLRAELAGAIAISSSAAMLVLAAGRSPWLAVALWVTFICRSLPSILYVRNRLLLEKGKPADTVGPIAAHVAAFAVAVALVATDTGSILAMAFFAFLALRSVIGLSRYRSKMKAMKIGIWEVVYGVATVAAVVFGHYFGL